MTTTNKDFVVKNGLVVQGATGTINGQFIVTEDALNTSLGDYIAITEKGSIDGVAELDGSQNVLTKTGVVFEGITADSYEVSLQLAADPGSDKTITIPDVNGTIVTTGNTNDAFPSQTGQTNKYLRTDGTNPYWSTVAGGGSSETLTIGTGLTGTSYDGTSAVTIAIDSTVVTTTGSQSLSSKTLTSPTLTSPYISSGGITFEGATDDTNETLIQVADPTEDRTITFPDATGTVALTSNIPSNTDGLSEGSTNLYFTNERAQDAIGDNLGTGLSYNDGTGAISVDTATIQARVADVSDTEIGYLNGVTSAIQTQLNNKQDKVADVSDTEIGYLNGVTSAIQTQIDNKLSLSGGTLTGALTLSGAPSSDLHAATKAYVDNVVAGINFHEAVHVATTANLSADYDNGTGGVGATLTASANAAWPTIDGHTSFTQFDRILVKDQTDQKQNGIYILSDLGSVSTKWVLTRATDADNSPVGEMKAGDFVFVQNGTANGGYGYINNSTASPIVIGTNNITYTQFNAGKTVIAGNGLLEATPGTLSIDTSITADLSTAQTLTNKTINLSNNTVSGTIAQFNTAVSDADLAILGSNTFTDNQLISVDTSGNALEVRQIGSGNALLIEDQANPDASPIVVDSIGRLILGTTSAVPGDWGSFHDKKVQISGIGSNQDANGLSIINASSSTSMYPQIVFGKSKSNSLTGRAAVTSSDTLGELEFTGTDGSGVLDGAYFRVNVDGSPAAAGTGSYIPTRMEFWTSTTSSSAERLRITKDGYIGINATPSTSQLLINNRTASNDVLVVKGAASQTGDLQEWQNSSGTVLARVNSSGQFVGDGSQLTGISAGSDPNPQIFMLMGA